MIALLPWLPYNVHCNRNNSTTTALLLFTLHYQLWLFSQRLDDLLTRELSLVPLVSSLHGKRHCWKCKVNKHKAVVCWLFYIISLIFLHYHNYLAIKNGRTGSSSSLSLKNLLFDYSITVITNRFQWFFYIFATYISLLPWLPSNHCFMKRVH